MAPDGYITQDEAKTVAAVAAQCLTWGGWRRWDLIMRYGRLFTPGTDVRGGAYPMRPEDTGRHAYRRAADSGLLYAEGYACRPIGMHIPMNWAWCLDGETVVDPGNNQPGTAYFGVALRPGYVRRVREAQRNDDGSDGFMWAFTRHEVNEVINPPLDPATDIVLDLGRDIPSSVRDWALTSERHPGGARQPPAWVVDELLQFGDRRPPYPPDPWLQALGLPPVGQWGPDTDAGPQRPRDMEPSEAPLPTSYAWYLVRRADWLDSGMALQCNGQTGGVFTDNGTVVSKIRVGDSLDTLIRMADDHRRRCEWAVSPGGEREHPELTAQQHAEVHLQWVTGSQADHSFAVLHRLDYNVWDAWLHPSRQDGEEPPVRLTRNGVSYEMALTAVFRVMGDEMPEEFAVVYPPFVLTAEQRATEAPVGALLPMSYARYLIYPDGTSSSGIAMNCSGQTGGIYSGETDGRVHQIQDGDSLDTLIRMADEHRPWCGWAAVYRADEREHPELTVQRRAAVHLKWVKDKLYENNFAVLRRLDRNVWDAWLQPWRLEGKIMTEHTAVRLMRNGVSYEMALMAVFRAMGDEMPEEFMIRYIYEPFIVNPVPVVLARPWGIGFVLAGLRQAARGL